MTRDKGPVLSLPARDIPAPKSVSRQAQQMLEQFSVLPPSPPTPPITDVAAWKQLQHDYDEVGMLAFFPASDTPLPLETRTLAGVRVHAVTPPDAVPERVYLYIHGGALVFGSGTAGRRMAEMAARDSGVAVVAVDYRMPPDFPYPTPLDDCIAVYRALLKDHEPGQIVVGGSSAGGNLAAALVLRARDEGLPMPAGVVLLTPEIDLTESGDTFQTNRLIDVTLRQGLPEHNALYANGHDLAHPYLSPLFGDFSKGFAKTFLQAGTRDLFLSNVVRMHRALLHAGVPVELHVFEAMPHGGFLGASPEDEDLRQSVRNFMDGCWHR